MSSKTTLGDIAQRLNISKNAVSLALRGKPGISEQLRQKILVTANEMNYSRIAPQTLPQPCANILALFPGRLSVRTTNSFYAQVCFHMENRAKSLGYNLVIASVDPEEELHCQRPSIMQSIEFFGIIAIGNLSKMYIRMLDTLGLRLICVDQYYPDLSINAVTSANMSGSYILTKHLIEMGHTDIEFLGQSYFTSSLYDRWIGYCLALAEVGLSPKENSYHYSREKHGDTDRQIIDTVLNEMPALPTAFVCGNDHIAAILIELLNQRGLSVPDDISVVGFDDLDIPNVTPHNLTTYHTRKAEMAFSALDSIIHFKADYPRNISIYGYPVYRKSVRQLKAENT